MQLVLGCNRYGPLVRPLANDIYCFVDFRKVNPYCCECSPSRSSNNYRDPSNVDHHNDHAGSGVGYELRVAKPLETHIHAPTKPNLTLTLTLTLTLSLFD